MGATTRFTHDPFGRLTAITDAHGGATHLTYEAAPGGFYTHRALTRPDGVTTYRRFDADGHLATVTDGEGRTTRYQHGAFGVLQTVTDPRGGVLRLAYDSEGRLAQVTNANNVAYIYERDAAGRVVAETDFDGRRIGYERDALGRVTARLAPDGGQLRYSYDPTGRVTAIAATEPGGAPGATETFTYDIRGLLIAAQNPAVTVGFERDAVGRVTVETQDARRIASTFDACGRRTERAIGTAPGWTGTGGRLPTFTGLTQADIQAGRILTPPQTEPPPVPPPDTVTHYAYDARGQLTTLSLGVEGTGAAADRLRLTHDALGRETSRENGRGFALYQLHDAVGQLVQQRVTARAETAHGRITGYDRHYRYDRAHAPVEISDDLWGTTSYQYDPNGQVTEARHGPDRRTTAGLTQPGVLGTAERYDQFGLEQETAEVERFRNDLAKDIVASDTATARTNPAPLTPWLTSPGGRVHAARGPAGERILLTHDVCGRVVVRRIEQDGFRAKVWTYRWDAFDRMTGCTNPDGETWRYQYDPFGRRVEKRCLSGARRTQAVLGTRFVWDGDLVAEALPITRDGAVEAAAGVTWHFEPGTFRPVAREAVGTGVHYVVNDHLGTPRELASAEGRISSSVRQLIWGETNKAWRERRGSSSNLASDAAEKAKLPGGHIELCPVRFQGQWHDEENETHYNCLRYYDPVTTQFLSPDPIGLTGGASPQAYVANPTSWIDPLGLTAVLRPGFKRVGRWMSKEELRQMQETGRVQQGAGGVTYVADSGPGSFGRQASPGSVYVEFDVPSSSLIAGGKPDWYRLVGPDANAVTRAKLLQQGGEMLPKFENLDHLHTK